MFPWVLLLCEDLLFASSLLLDPQINQLTSLSFRVLHLCVPRGRTAAKLSPCLISPKT